jgi:hypothetical protein
MRQNFGRKVRCSVRRMLWDPDSPPEYNEIGISTVQEPGISVFKKMSQASRRNVGGVLGSGGDGGGRWNLCSSRRVGGDFRVWLFACEFHRLSSKYQPFLLRFFFLLLKSHNETMYY